MKEVRNASAQKKDTRHRNSMTSTYEPDGNLFTLEDPTGRKKEVIKTLAQIKDTRKCDSMTRTHGKC
jgi:hypothetical protein